ncbi:hypothetical protein [Enterobacter roggenkampii]
MDPVEDKRITLVENELVIRRILNARTIEGLELICDYIRRTMSRAEWKAYDEFISEKTSELLTQKYKIII